MAEEKFISKYTANEIESMLDKVKTDMQIIQYTQSEINTLLGKIDNMTQPTKISDLQDDSNFITNTVANLVNYYTKTQTYTKEEVNSLINSSASGGFLVVESLPTTDISTHNIYLILSTSGKTKNLYDEYINIDGTANGWELIGSTKMDLTGYVTSTQLSTALADYLTTVDFQNALKSYYTKTEVDNLISQIDTSGSGGSGTSEKVPGNALIDRWLRFDPDNKRGVIIKAGTNIKLPNGSIKSYITDTHIDLTSYITQGGADYYLYIDNNGDISAYTDYQSTGNKIGRLHTLCVDVGVNVTMTAPAPASSGYTTNTDYLIKSYRQEKDPDFYAFYNKKVKTVTTQSQYDVVTIDHPLSGFQAGDILPESVFCLNWYPDTLFEDGMVYDKDINKVIDIYLQSGTGHNTRSKYNQTHTVSRQPYNHAEDMRMVGKMLLYDNEFTSAALGSNEKTSITGTADASTVGGHKDTNNRRMISAIGCEEMCGYLWQWLQETSSVGGGWVTTDQNASFGLEFGDPYVLRAGGHWDIGASCGSRSRFSDIHRSLVSGDSGGRGSGRILTK
jgi:hypothetical protein